MHAQNPNFTFVIQIIRPFKLLNECSTFVYVLEITYSETSLIGPALGPKQVARWSY